MSSDNSAVVYRVTSRADLAEFRDRYIIVNQIIKATGLSQRQVRYMIRANGVPPAITTAEGGCAFYESRLIELSIKAARR